MTTDCVNIIPQGVDTYYMLAYPTLYRYIAAPRLRGIILRPLYPQAQVKIQIQDHGILATPHSFPFIFIPSSPYSDHQQSNPHPIHYIKST
jgi:hypothetical protein